MTGQIPAQTDARANHQRFLLLDGLRGIAAVGVVINHSILANELTPVFERFAPAALLQMAYVSVSGVWIFFVISGFIIAHSLRNDALTNLSVGRFILRRHTRLDPPYWCAIFLFLFCVFLLSSFSSNPDYKFALPSLSTIFVNLFYLQKLTPPPQILGVSWTLCIEIQFYIFFILILYFCKRIQSRFSVFQKFKKRELEVAVIFAFTLFSIALWATPLRHTKLASVAVFFSFWYFFSSGVFLYWFFKKEIDLGLLVTTFCLICVATFLNLYITKDWGSFSPQLTCLATFLLLYAAIANNKLSSWLNSPLFLYFGKLSYSLYLVHYSVITLAFGLLEGHVSSPALALFCYISVMIGIVALSHLWWRWIELPSLNLASSLRKTPLPSTEPSLAKAATTEAVILAPSAVEQSSNSPFK